MRRLLPALLAALSITWTTTWTTPWTTTATAEPTAEPITEYVALGDSAAAGPLIPVQDETAPGCLRSSRNWPSVLASAIGARLTDVTCSGAVTDDLAGSQSTLSGPQPPQLDALGESTDLVTLTIGGNDIELVRVALSCVNVFPEPVGESCRDRLTTGGRDEVAERIDAYAPEFADALDRISARAPNARIVVVGYGTYLKPGGCYPDEPIWARDADYIQAGIHRLNAVFATESARHGARFVDIAPPSVGHDVCAERGVKWFEGLTPVGPVAPLHPNKLGMDEIGRFVATRL
ncbi:SGNH/GDSL hydrolase family protein [Saccharothrix deserti]|uniref:SGNH/GDSL hydrolase family protein n=1 Tax=Saccharothrix deserti TaxID=2593674 RepID=UPI001EE48E8D|nr:SGNH/GDSL hydrolase family protein [Saccharothrix deserti]